MEGLLLFTPSVCVRAARRSASLMQLPALKWISIVEHFPISSELSTKDLTIVVFIATLRIRLSLILWIFVFLLFHTKPS